ncbi:MAG: WbqC family protein [Bacteroidales bacterium]|nr:WbqC family protein [Bacteroidales bacterium]
MTGKILLSTAYLPPVEYFARIKDYGELFIEREENYLKQSYRNRCYILSAGGPHLLTVPVYTGSFHKTPVKDIRIDYSKRWQQIHSGALKSSYNASPYFQYYLDTIERIIQSNYKFLLDLNMDLLVAILRILQIERKISYTIDFEPIAGKDGDFRYTISPKRDSIYTTKEYLQVFRTVKGFVPGLSIVDLIFNMGPEAISYL